MYKHRFKLVKIIGISYTAYTDIKPFQGLKGYVVQWAKSPKAVCRSVFLTI